MEDSYSKIERARRNYEHSEKGKAKNKRYNLSDKGKASRDKYLQSEKGKAAILRYYLSEKAKTARDKRRALEKLFRLVRKFVIENPGTSPNEALEKIIEGKEV